MPRTVKYENFDYIIVGAGSAGCVLANRLSRDPATRVLLIESGPRDRHWTIRIPGGIRYHQNESSPFNWHFHTEPQSYLNNRRIYQPRGRTLGGSSSINGMVFLRGHRLDYDRWESEGAQGWSYSSVLPFFKKLESYASSPSMYRGDDGPVAVRRQEELIELDQTFLEAGREAGFPYTDDPNGENQEGFCRFDMNVDRGIRASTSWAYLRQCTRRPNLTVKTRCDARRVILHNGRAESVEVNEGTDIKNYRAEREVIIAGGAFGSPKILMCSGIGPADHLKTCGINPIVDLKGVGENLQDHIEVHVQHLCTKPIALNGYLGAAGMLKAGLQWILTRSGVAARSQMNVGAFLRSNPMVDHPDIQFHFFPVLFDDRAPVVGKHGYRLGAGPMRPASRGNVRLDPNNPYNLILIDPRYLSEEGDRMEMRDAFRFARETLAQPAFKKLDGGEVVPGPAISSDTSIDEYIRNTASSAYHPVGTCKMGDRSKSDTVVDSSCKVVGIESLRVIDASIMPNIISSNTNAATMMIAEKMSDHILKGG